MGQAKNRKAEIAQLKANGSSFNMPAGAFKLYSLKDIKKDVCGATQIMTPEGFISFRSDIVNVAIYEPNQEQPSFKMNTGYGCSYVAQTNMGAHRYPEYILGVHIGGEYGWLMQVTFTSKIRPTGEDAKAIVLRVLASLPVEYRNVFNQKQDISVHQLQTTAGLV